ncbi:MAG: MMPL family transporter [Planctomycetota bacterium]
MIKRLFELNARLVIRRPGLVLVLCAAVTLALAWPALHLRADFDLVNLLPAHAPEVRDLRMLMEDFGGDDRLVIAVEAADDAGIPAAEDHLRRVAALIRERDAVRAEPLLEPAAEVAEADRDALIRFLFDRAPLLADGPAMDKLLARLTPAGVTAAVAEAGVRMRSGGVIDRERIKKDPLGLAGILLDRVPPAMRATGVDTLRRSADGRFMLLEFHPVRPPQDGAFSRTLTAFARECAAAAARDAAVPVPEVIIAGGYAQAAGDMQRLTAALLSTVVSSVAAVVVILALAYREFLFVGLAALWLGVAVFWTAGCARLWFGDITAVSAAFAAILVGLGIDFAIHVYNRFRVEIAAGLTPEAAMVRTQIEAGPAVWMGAITTAAAFFVLAITDFPGVREFGLIVGCGVLIAALVYFTGFAAMTYRAGVRGFKRDLGADCGMGRVCDILARAPRLAAGIFIAASLAAVIYVAVGRPIGFENDPRNLRPKNDPAIAADDRCGARIGGSLVRFPVMVSADSFDDLLTRLDGVAAGLQRLKAEGRIAGYMSPGDLLAPPDRQARNLARLARVDFPAARTAFAEALAQSGFKPAAFGETLAWLDRLAARAAAGRGLAAEEFNDPAVHARIGAFFKVDPAAGKFRALSVFYTMPGEERRFDAGLIGAAVGADGEHVFVTGVNIINRVVTERIAATMRWIFPVVALVNTLFLYATFRSVRYTLLAAAPLAFGVAFLLAVMKFTEVPFNVMNFGIIPMVIGIGADNGIHIVQNYLNSCRGRAGVRSAVCLVSRPVIMTALTTIAGFGSLVIAEYRGIIGLGMIAAFGVAFCLLAAIIFLPAALMVWGGEPKTEKTGQATEGTENHRGGYGAEKR